MKILFLTCQLQHYLGFLLSSIVYITFSIWFGLYFTYFIFLLCSAVFHSAVSVFLSTLWHNNCLQDWYISIFFCLLSSNDTRIPQNKPFPKTLLALVRRSPHVVVKRASRLWLPSPPRWALRQDRVLADSQLCYVGVNTNSSSPPVTGGNTEASPRLFQDNPRSGLERRQAVKVSDMTTLVPSLRLLHLDTHLARRKRPHFSVILQPHARRHTHTRTAVLLPVRYAQQRTVTKRPFQVRLFLNFIFLNVAVNATPLSEPSGVYVRSHSGSSAFWQPAVDPVRQCGLMERLEFLSWSSLSLCFFFFSFPRLAYLFCVCDVCVHHSEDDVFSAWRSVAVWLSMWAALEPVSTCRWAEAVVLLRLWVDLVRLFTRVFSSVFRFWTLVECSVGCMDSCFFFKCSNHWTSLIYKGGGLSVSWSEVRGQSTDQDPWCRGDEPLCQVWPLSNQTAGVRWAQTPSGLCSTDH